MYVIAIVFSWVCDKSFLRYMYEARKGSDVDVGHPLIAYVVILYFGIPGKPYYCYLAVVVIFTYLHIK